MQSACIVNVLREFLAACGGRAAVNAKNATGLTPLLCEVEKMRSCTLPIVTMLLKAGADPSIEGAKGKSALDIVLSKGASSRFSASVADVLGASEKQV